MQQRLPVLLSLAVKACLVGMVLVAGTANGYAAGAGHPANRGATVTDVNRLSDQASLEQLEAFRRQRLSGDYVFRFNLVHYPRRGEKVSYDGYLWGTWTDKGPLSRIAIWEDELARDPSMELIVQNGPEPQVWMLGEDGRAFELEENQMRQPVIDGIVYTPFDLLMPFIYWDDFDYLGGERRSGRPHDVFLMKPPSSWKEKAPDLEGVNLTIDRNFRALNRIEEVDAEGEALRTFKVVSFKEVDSEYIVKEIDLIDEVSRDKTRFRVMAAAVNLNLPQSTFDPRAIGRGLPPVRGVKFQAL
ncbi:MAG: hypothetical protein AAGA45_01295 [Verrucomicrobiota bacterium]